MAFRNSKIVLIVLQFAAFWSVWRWYFLRLSASADEFYGVISLAAICLICLKNRKPRNEFPNFGLVAFSMFFYAVSFPFLPPILRAAIAFTSLTFTLSGWFFGRKFHFGIWTLFLLGLPLVASLQFYFGFPLRVLVGEAVVILLKINGLSVIREGVALNFAGQSVWIDAPCSGIKMLWTGFFLTALLVTIYEFRFVKTIVAMFAALGIILLGNIFRAVGLFYLETGLIKLPASAHEAIGTSAFLLTCVGIVAMILRLRNVNTENGKSFLTILSNRSLMPTVPNFSQKFEQTIFALACLAAFAVPFLIGGKDSLKTISASVNFPTVFEDKPLRRLDLTEREEIFLQDFPGDVARFTDGRREIIFRYVTEATRKLHPSADCFSAIGYAIKPLPLKIDEKDQKWSCFAAHKGEEKLKVCERIFTDNGESWTDVSSWYWSALTVKNSSVYKAVTVAETLE